MTKQEILARIAAHPTGGNDWVPSPEGETLQLGHYRAVVSRRGQVVGSTVHHDRYGEMMVWVHSENTPAAKALALRFIASDITD